MEIRPIISAMLRSKTSTLLVLLQIAISFALLVNALHTVSLRVATVTRPSGVSPEKDVFQVTYVPVARLPHEAALAQQKKQEAMMAAIPGVAAVTYTSQIPLSDSGSQTGLTGEKNAKEIRTNVSDYIANETFVKTFGLKIIEGRDFTAGDVRELNPEKDRARPEFVILTKEYAQRLFPDATSYVGKLVYWGTSENANVSTVIGIVERLQTTSAQSSKFGKAGEYSAISPGRGSLPSTIFAVRAEPGQRDRVMKEVETALQQAGDGAAIIKTQSFESIRNARYRNDTGLALLLTALSVVLLLVTVSGVVGMTSMWVTQRTKTIGVRRALGAKQSDILRYFLTENVLITIAGVAFGALLALGLNQLISTKFSIEKLPLHYLAYACALFFTLGLIAAFAPARRAAKISPAIATRGL